MNENGNRDTRLARFLDKVFSHPVLKISVLVFLALICAVLFYFFGKDPGKEMMLAQTPVICLFAFLAVYVVFWAQGKNPYCSPRALDIFELVFLMIFVLCVLIFGISFALDLERGYLPTLPGVLVCLCAQTLYHSRRKDR